MASSLELDIKKLLPDMEEFRLTLSDIDEDRIVRNAVRKTAEDMTEIVVTNIAAHPGIQFSLASRYYQGGPHPDDPSGDEYFSSKGGATMFKEEFWNVDLKSDGSAVVRPSPLIEDRATILEVGHGGARADPDNPFRFYVDGAPEFTQELDPLEARQYWQMSVTQIKKEGRLESHLRDELEEEIERAG